MPTLTEAMKEAVATAPADIPFYDAILIESTAFDAFRFVNSEKDEVFNSLTYTAKQFRIKNPVVEANSNPTMQITVSGIDLSVADTLDDAVDSAAVITVNHQGFLSTSTAPQLQFDRALEAADITMNGNNLTITASFPDLVNRPFPFNRYNAQNFPGLRS